MPGANKQLGTYSFQLLFIQVVFLFQDVFKIGAAEAERVQDVEVLGGRVRRRKRSGLRQAEDLSPLCNPRKSAAQVLQTILFN